MSRARHAKLDLVKSNLLQTAVTILVAAVIAVGAWMSSQANAEWQSGVRQEVKRSAAAIEDIRYVYSDEAPLALRVAMAEARAAQLQTAADASDQSGVTANLESAAEAHTAAHIRHARRNTGELVDGERYQRDFAYDVPRRLADVRRTHPGIVRLAPADVHAGGDRMARRAVLLVATTIPMVLLYLLIRALLRARPSPSRTADRARAASATDVGLVPHPAPLRDPRRSATVLALLAWIMIVILPTAQLLYSTQEQRAQAVAAREAVQVSARIEGSNLAVAFRSESRRTVELLGLQSNSRGLATLEAAPGPVTAAELVRAGSDQAVQQRLRLIASVMSREPTAKDGVDAYTRELVNATPDDWTSLGAQQARDARLAERAGRRSDLLGLALLLTSLALSLAALAAASPSRATTAAHRAAAGLLTTAALAATAGLIS